MGDGRRRVGINTHDQTTCMHLKWEKQAKKYDIKRLLRNNNNSNNKRFDKMKKIKTF